MRIGAIGHGGVTVYRGGMQVEQDERANLAALDVPELYDLAITALETTGKHLGSPWTAVAAKTFRDASSVIDTASAANMDRLEAVHALLRSAPASLPRDVSELANVVLRFLAPKDPNPAVTLSHAIDDAAEALRRARAAGASI